MKAKKKVLFYHFTFPYGGGERVTCDIARWIRNYGYDAVVATCHKRENISDVSDINLVELPDRDPYLKKNAEAVVRLIQTLSIDIFVLPGFFWNHLAYVKESCPGCKFVYILHNIPWWEEIAKRERKLHAPKKGMLKLMEWYIITLPKISWLNVYHRRYAKEYKEVYSLVDAYVALCDGYKEDLVRRLGLPEKNKIRVIENTEYPAEDVNLEKKKQVLFLGRMDTEQKRVDRLLDIWAMVCGQLTDWELVLVGGGPEEQNLRRKAAEMNLERVRFAGWAQKPAEFYKYASVFCLTSTFEGWPLCLTEAQANGVVPVAFNCCAGIEEILSPSGVNGILIDPFDKKKFADKLYELLTSPKELEQMRNNVLRKSKEYSIEKIGKKWLDLFDELTE